MKITIILEAKLSTVVGDAASYSGAIPVPYCIWALLGECHFAENEDGLTLAPLQELDSTTGELRKSDTYFFGSISHEDMIRLIGANHGVRLLGPIDQLELCIQCVKGLGDLFTELGHEVLLLETCDF